VAIVTAVLALCVGANTGCGPVAARSGTANAPAAAGPTSPAAATSAPEQVAGDPTLTTAPASPVVETKEETVRQAIPFSTRMVNDSSLTKGTQKVRTKGVSGARTITYVVTYTNGVETGRTVKSEKVTKQPVTQVVAVGTKTSRCDPNYSGCVPIASDVDCAGGSGDGPAYVKGPIQVIGTDIYDLDRDGDGIACE
jgi:resuscitation-promoting factor RpfB